MTEPHPTPLLQELIHLVGGLAHRMRTHLEAVSAEFGLSAIEGRALFRLDTPRSMSELAGELRCDASYVTFVADHLEDEGLVERQIDPHDRRMKRLVITDKGRQVRQRMQVRAEQDLPATAGLSPAQQQTLRDLLVILATHANQTCGDSPSSVRSTMVAEVELNSGEQTSGSQAETTGGQQ